jgi:putative transposase
MTGMSPSCSGEPRSGALNSGMTGARSASIYLLIALELERPDPTPDQVQLVAGVDVGQRYLATVATTSNGAQFYSGKEVRARADHYARLRTRLQQKGTRSATRKLVAISGRERRLKLNTNHVISKHAVQTHPHAVIGLEDLNGIRERTKRRKKRRTGRMGAVSGKARRANRHASKWAFAELQGTLAYKAALAGSLYVKVEAAYTSQTCPRCGLTSKENRPHHGLLFVCTGCQYTLHANLVGARNVALRTLLVRQDWTSTGWLSGSPDVTDTEAKAKRRQRYLELWWSPVTSPSALGDLGT